MESIVSTFHIDWKIILAQAVNFGLVLLVLYFFAVKPLQKLMRERSERIARGVADAKANALLLEKSQSEYKATLVRARKEGEEFFEKAKREAIIEKEKLLEDARLEVARVKADGERKMEEEKIRMVKEAKGEVASLVLQASERLLDEKLPRGYDAKAIEELIKV